MDQIAQLFRVTRQRVSALLRDGWPRHPDSHYGHAIAVARRLAYPKWDHTESATAHLEVKLGGCGRNLTVREHPDPEPARRSGPLPPAAPENPP